MLRKTPSLHHESRTRTTQDETLAHVATVHPPHGGYGESFVNASRLWKTVTLQTLVVLSQTAVSVTSRTMFPAIIVNVPLPLAPLRSLWIR